MGVQTTVTNLYEKFKIHNLKDKDEDKNRRQKATIEYTNKQFRLH